MQSGLPVIVESPAKACGRFPRHHPELPFVLDATVVPDAKKVVARSRRVTGAEVEGQSIRRSSGNRNARLELIQLVSAVCVQQRNFDFDAAAEHVSVEEGHLRSESGAG